MPNQFDTDAIFEEALKQVETETGKNRTFSSSGEGGDVLKLVYQIHGEGSGHYGGRDNALTKLVGVLRSRRFPYEVGQIIAAGWNEKCCRPPLPSDVVEEKVSRAWAEWSSSDIPDATPEDFKNPPKPEEKTAGLKFLTTAEIFEEAERLGGLKWVVENVFPAGGLVYFSAPPAGAKTWLLVDLVRSLMHGGRWIDTFDVPQLPVLYLDEEMGAVKMADRLRKIGVKPTDPGLWYSNKIGINLAVDGDLNDIVRLIHDNGIKVVIIDTLTRIHRFEENDNTQMRQLYTRFQKIIGDDVLLIVAHHDRKGGQGESSVGHDRMRGAGDIAASADMTYSVEKKGDWFRLVTTKTRLVSEDDAATVDFILEDGEGGLVKVSPIDADTRSNRKIDSIGRAVLDYLETEVEANTRQIVSKVAGDTTAITEAVRKLLADGVVRVRDGERGAKFYSIAGGKS